MAKNIIQMQLLTYQTNKNTHQIIIIIANKQTKTKFLLLFLIFQSFSHETKSWFEHYYNIKKIYLKKLLKTANLRTKHRGNSLTEPSVNRLGKTIGRLRK